MEQALVALRELYAGRKKKGCMGCGQKTVNWKEDNANQYCQPHCQKLHHEAVYMLGPLFHEHKKRPIHVPPEVFVYTVLHHAFGRRIYSVEQYAQLQAMRQVNEEWRRLIDEEVIPRIDYITWHVVVQMSPEEFSRYPSLKKLTLPADGVSAAALTSLTNLRALDFVEVGNSRYERVVSRLTNLRQLRIPAGVYNEDLVPLTNLVRLDVSNNRNVDDVALIYLTNLETLIMDMNYTIDGSSFPALRKLRKLDMSRFKEDKAITDETLSQATGLTELRMGNNRHITDAGLAPLTALESLWLSKDQRITDAALRGMTRLVELGILRSAVVTNVARWPALRSLDANRHVRWDQVRGLTRLVRLKMEEAGGGEKDFQTGGGQCVADAMPFLTILELSERTIITPEQRDRLVGRGVRLFGGRLVQLIRVPKFTGECLRCGSEALWLEDTGRKFCSRPCQERHLRALYILGPLFEQEGEENPDRGGKRGRGKKREAIQIPDEIFADTMLRLGFNKRLENEYQYRQLMTMRNVDKEWRRIIDSQVIPWIEYVSPEVLGLMRDEELVNYTGLVEMKLNNDPVRQPEILTQLPRLVALDMSGASPMYDGAVSRLTQLETLTLQQQVTIDFLSRLTGLHSLNLGMNQKINDDDLLFFPLLTKLSVGHNTRVNGSVFGELNHLHTLDISHTTEEPHNIVNDLTLRLPMSLTSLNMANNFFVGAGLGVRELTNLQWLDIQGTRVLQQDALRKLTRLTHLWLARSRSNESGVPITQLTNLQLLQVDRYRTYTDIKKLTQLTVLDMKASWGRANYIPELWSTIVDDLPRLRRLILPMELTIPPDAMDSLSAKGVEVVESHPPEDLIILL
jgi:hypothetical protein